MTIVKNQYEQIDYETKYTVKTVEVIKHEDNETTSNVWKKRTNSTVIDFKCFAFVSGPFKHAVVCCLVNLLIITMLILTSLCIYDTSSFMETAD